MYNKCDCTTRIVVLTCSKQTFFSRINCEQFDIKTNKKKHRTCSFLTHWWRESVTKQDKVLFVIAYECSLLKMKESPWNYSNKVKNFNENITKWKHLIGKTK